jgi:hypothetical protein
MLSPEQRRYLTIAQGLVPGVINVVIAAALGWLTFRSTTSIPVWAQSSSAGPDTLGTCFFLPAITCLIVTPLVRRHVRARTVEALAPHALPRALERFHRPVPFRAPLLGLATLASVGVVAGLCFLALGIQEIPLGPFLVFKAAFAGLLAAAVTPAIGLLALADPPQPEP